MSSMGRTLDYHIERDGLVLSLCYIEETEHGAETVVADFRSRADDGVDVYAEIMELEFENAIYRLC